MEGETQKITTNVIITIILGLILSNLFIIDLVIIASKTSPKEKNDAVIQKESTIQSTLPLTQETTISQCPHSCLVKIYEATSSQKFVQSSPGLVATKTVLPTIIENSSGVKEYYVALGSGINTSDEWLDIPGAQSYIDSTKYGKISKVTFEASIQIQNGNQKAYARLYNATDKHPVWFSEVSLEGGQALLLISNPITLDEGNKSYQVQLKSQLKGPTNLLQSKVHIIVQ